MRFAQRRVPLFSRVPGAEIVQLRRAPLALAPGACVGGKFTYSKNKVEKRRPKRAFAVCLFGHTALSQSAQTARDPRKRSSTERYDDTTGQLTYSQKVHVVQSIHRQ